jgi:hypothetical protein
MRFASKTGDSPSGACPTRNAPTGVTGLLRCASAAGGLALVTPEGRIAWFGLLASSLGNSTVTVHERHARARSCLDAMHHGINSSSSTLVGDFVAANWSKNSDVESQLSPGVLLRVTPCSLTRPT